MMPQNAKDEPLTMDALRAYLAGFTGSETFYKHTIGWFVYTEGIKALADKAGAYWLIDLVGSYQRKLRDAPFQVWRLVVEPDHTAVADCREDTDATSVVTQRIPYSDFPAGTFECYYIDNVMLLKSEY